MILKSVSFLLLASTLQAAPTQPTFLPGADPKPSTATWLPVTTLSDEFEGPMLDHSKWQDEPVGNGWGWYGRAPGLFHARKVSVQGGEMRVAGPAVLRDAENRPVRPFARDRRAVVLVFMAPDCPISNRYLPRLKAIATLCADHSIDFWLVYPDAAVGPEQLRQHRKEYDHALPALLDPEHTLVRHAGATVTPEAAVFIPAADPSHRQLLYRGRIDDTWQDFGVRRPSPTQEDLADVIVAIAADRKPEVRTTKAVGCYISH